MNINLWGGCNQVLGIQWKGVVQERRLLMEEDMMLLCEFGQRTFRMKQVRCETSLDAHILCPYVCVSLLLVNYCVHVPP